MSPHIDDSPQDRMNAHKNARLPSLYNLSG